MTPEEIEEYIRHTARLYRQGALSEYQSSYLQQFGGVLALAARERPWLRRGARIWGYLRVDDEELERRVNSRWQRHESRIRERIRAGMEPVAAVSAQLGSHGVSTVHSPFDARELGLGVLQSDSSGNYTSPMWEADAVTALRHAARRLQRMEVLTQDPVAGAAATTHIASRVTNAAIRERLGLQAEDIDLDNMTEEQLEDAVRFGEATSNVVNILAPAAQRRTARRTGVGELSGPVAQDPVNRAAVVQVQQSTAQPRSIGGRGRTTGAAVVQPPRPRQRRPSPTQRQTQRQRATRESADPARWQADRVAVQRGTAAIVGGQRRGTVGQPSSPEADQPSPTNRHVSATAERPLESGRQTSRRRARQPHDADSSDIPLGRPVSLEDQMLGAIHLPAGGSAGPARARVATLQRIRTRIANVSSSVQRLYQRLSVESATLADVVDLANRSGRNVARRFRSNSLMNQRQRQGYLNGVVGRIAEHLFHMQFRGAGRATAEQLVRQLRLPANARVSTHYATRAYTLHRRGRAEITDGMYFAEIRYPRTGDRPARTEVVLLCAGEAKSSVSALLQSFRTSTSRSGRHHDPQPVRVQRRLNTSTMVIDIPGSISRQSPTGEIGARTMRLNADQVSVHPNFVVYVGTPRLMPGEGAGTRRRVRDARARFRGQGIRVEPLRLHNSEADVAVLGEQILEAAIASARASQSGSSGAPVAQGDDAGGP